MLTLSEQEKQALNDFIGEKWSEFKESAEKYLSNDEIEKLGEKLEG